MRFGEDLWQNIPIFPKARLTDNTNDSFIDFLFDNAKPYKDTDFEKTINNWKENDNYQNEIEDYLAVAKILNKYGPAFDWESYRPRIKVNPAIVFGFDIGWGSGIKTGFSDASGNAIGLPVNSPIGRLGIITGIRFAGFRLVADYSYNYYYQDRDYEGVEFEGLEILDRDYHLSKYGAFFGYDILIARKLLSLTPLIGYAVVDTEAYLKATVPKGESREDSILEAIKEVKNTDSLSGMRFGGQLNWYTDWEYLSGYARYEAVAITPFLNFGSIGVGVARWQGFGVYFCWRQMWSENVNYAFGGVTLAGDIPL